MKVFAIFKVTYSMPFHTEELIELYERKERADNEVNKLNGARSADEMPNGDTYGYFGGHEYGVVSLEIK